MNRRGVILPLVLVGILATVALIPFLVTNTETITKNITAIDESNRIYWAAEGAACDAYKKSLKSNSTIDMASLTIDIKDENIKIASSPRFQYKNDFVATTTLDTQSTIHEERACWTATGGAKDYDFEGKIKATYVKPGVFFDNAKGSKNDKDEIGYAWDKNGILYKIIQKNNKNFLEKVTQIKEPVWQATRNYVIDADGKARDLSDGTKYNDASNGDPIVVANIYNKNTMPLTLYRLSKNNNVLNSNGAKIKWKNLLDDNSGVLNDVVQIDGRYNHIFALKSNGDLYGWGDNVGENQNNPDSQILRKLGNDNKIKKSFSDEEAVLIKTQNAISNSVVDLTYYIDHDSQQTTPKYNPVGDYFSDTDKFLYLGNIKIDNPHHCINHEKYTDSCNDCKKIKNNPWTNNRIYKFSKRNLPYPTEDKNCMCDLCNEIREINTISKSTSQFYMSDIYDSELSEILERLDIFERLDILEGIINTDEKKLDPKSSHTDMCHCINCSYYDPLTKKRNNSYCHICNNMNPFCVSTECRKKREHFWGCYCYECEKNRNNFFVTNNNDWRIYNKSNVPNPSTPFYTDEDLKITNLQLLVDTNSAYFKTKNSFYNRNNYRTVVEFRAKFVPTNKNHIRDIGTYKSGGTTDNLNEIYLFEGGKISIDTASVCNLLPKVCLVTFTPTIKKDNNIIEKLPKGNYEVIFERRPRLEIKSGNDWIESPEQPPEWAGDNTWIFMEPYNMLWGVDKNGVTNNNKYFGCIFRLNEYLFNVTSGRLWEPHKVCAVSAGQYFSVILAKNTEDAIVNQNKYKIMTCGSRKDYRLGREGNLGKKLVDRDLSEVFFKDDNGNVIDVAQYIRSIKTGKRHTLVLTDDGTKRELWTWGQKEQFTFPYKLKLDLDAPIVSIACGDTKNMLITENNTVYLWNNTDEKVDSTKIIPRQ